MRRHWWWSVEQQRHDSLQYWVITSYFYVFAYPRPGNGNTNTDGIEWHGPVDSGVMWLALYPLWLDDSCATVERAQGSYSARRKHTQACGRICVHRHTHTHADTHKVTDCVLSKLCLLFWLFYLSVLNHSSWIGSTVVDQQSLEWCKARSAFESWNQFCLFLDILLNSEDWSAHWA